MWHTAVDHSNLQYTPTVATEKCQNTLLYFFTDPFNILGNSLCKISILVWTCFMYRLLDVIWQYVVWYCKVKRVGGGRGTDDVHKMRKKFERKHCPENVHGNLCCMKSCRQLDRAWRRSVWQCCLTASWLSNFRYRKAFLAHF